MKKDISIGLDFVIDKLTNSIENVITGDSFMTVISILTRADLKLVSKKNGWLFDWKSELKEPARDIYKLTIVGNQTIIQGLISLEVKIDHVYMHLVESAPFIKEKQRCIQEFLATWLHLHANYHFSEDMKEMFHFYLNHNLLTTMKRLWEPSILVAE